MIFRFLRSAAAACISRAKRGGLCLALAAALAAGLCACAGQNNALPANAPTVTIGMDPFEPYCYLDSNGQYAGIDVELATEAFSRLGYKVEFQEINWPDKDSLLQDGTVDCLWACFSMNGRADQYQWSGPYMYSRQVVAVRADSKHPRLGGLGGQAHRRAGHHQGRGAVFGQDPLRLAGGGAGQQLCHDRGYVRRAAQGLCGRGLRA